MDSKALADLLSQLEEGAEINFFGTVVKRMDNAIWQRLFDVNEENKVKDDEPVEGEEKT
ncbi:MULTISPECIES: hypothetical protein [unclassified Nostoc]|uniref:hypothetical protein n=1 Tax=unclassified Nostoc TaxID=2593658 RepID=UPI0015E2B4B0|nr:hypothetical protein [Nostoc sp. 'Peltigera membranacea cyanobiont' N6]